MKCRLTRPMSSGEEPGRILPAGHLIEHADAYLLVRMSIAEPADDECQRAADMTPEKTEAARRAFERLDHGISPEDFEDFDAGRMTGYYADGTPIPGPNAEPPEPSEFEAAFLDV